MSRAHTGKQSMIAAGLATLGAFALSHPAAGAMALSSLTGPTVQTLIDLGSDGATAGDARYFNFSYAASANAPAASAVNIQPVGTNDTSGLRFVASWLAGNGSAVSSTVSYDVASLDGSPISAVSLLSNGTAPVPADETFATATMSTDTQAGSPVAPILSTYDDGRTFPTDTTATDFDSATSGASTPQSPLAITDTLTVVAGNGGLATASFLQNGFTFASATTAAVPEPTLGPALVGVALASRRRRVTRAK